MNETIYYLPKPNNKSNDKKQIPFVDPARTPARPVRPSVGPGAPVPQKNFITYLDSI